MNPILSLPPDQFRAALAELQLDPQREAELVRQYRRSNSVMSPLYGLLERISSGDAQEGMQRASLLPVTRPEGMSVVDAIGSGDARLAVPQSLFDLIGGGAQAIDAPAAAAQGLIPAEDMVGEALNLGGFTMGAGGAASRPAGSVGMGGRVARDFDVSRRDASNIFGEGSERVRYTDPESGGTMEVVVRPDGRASVLELEVPEDFRGQGIGQSLQARVMQDFPVMGGQVSSKAAATTAYRLGRRPYAMPDATLEDVFRIMDEDSSVNLISPAAQPNELSSNRSTAGGLLAAAAETPAQRVARMLREGRADEVTDDLMAQADPQEMYRLYEAGETGADMPMDEASRMARARGMGFVDDQYHATFDDFPAFMASETGLTGRGVYTGDDAGDVMDYARSRRTSTEGLNAIPLLAPEGSTYARRIDWQNTLDADPDLPYNATWQQNVEGMRRAADTMSNQGFPGVHSQPGERVTFNPNRLRSRFARFDPRLSHLENLNAANVDPITGLAAMSASQQNDPLANLRAYIAAAGGVLGR